MGILPQWSLVRQWNKSTLIQMMPCRLFSPKQLHQLMLMVWQWFDNANQNTQMLLKMLPQNGALFVPALVCYWGWPGPWFNIKMTSYQYRKSHCGDKAVVRSSYLHNGVSYTGKMTSLYWTSPQPHWWMDHVLGIELSIHLKYINIAWMFIESIICTW